MAEKPSALLSIAGFDPTGGAGIIRDILTFKQFGHYATAVITANTAQNTKGVKSVIFEPCKIIKEQLLLLFEEFNIKGVKIGLPHKDHSFNTWLANFLKEKKIPVVFDPVIKPTAGKSFVTDIKSIIPLIKSATVITPNEKEFNTIKPFINPSEIPYIIIKGKKEKDTVKDLLLEKGQLIETVTHKKDSLEVHGTGCAFSSALLSFIVHGDKTKEAFIKASIFLKNFRKHSVRGLEQNIYLK